MVICVQCSMRAILNGEPPPSFDETPEQHKRRAHPDSDATQAERNELERQFAEKMKGVK